MKLTLSISGNTGIMLINKLFDLNYHPSQIVVWCTSNSVNAELVFFCKQCQIPVTCIDTLRDLYQLDEFGDVLLSIAGTPLLIPDCIVDRFTLGAINLHPADTEKYRGRWMVSWCIINQEPTVGYTWHYMNNKYDTGNILLKQNFKITKQDTALSLNARIFSHAIFQLENLLSLVGTPGQSPSKIGKYYDKSIPFNGIIQPNWDIDTVDRFVRAMYHPPHTPAILEKNGKLHYINNIKEFVIAQNI
jgi:methionyl-tRNA formyltransferase